MGVQEKIYRAISFDKYVSKIENMSRLDAKIHFREPHKNSIDQPV